MELHHAKSPTLTNLLHWIGLALGLLVVIGGIRLFVRGLSSKPSDPSTRAPESWAVVVAAVAQPTSLLVRTAWVVLSGPRSGPPSIARSSASRVRARLTRLLIVPTALPQICAASS